MTFRQLFGFVAEALQEIKSFRTDLSVVAWLHAYRPRLRCIASEPQFSFSVLAYVG